MSTHRHSAARRRRHSSLRCRQAFPNLAPDQFEAARGHTQPQLQAGRRRARIRGRATRQLRVRCRITRLLRLVEDMKKASAKFKTTTANRVGGSG